MLLTADPDTIDLPFDPPRSTPPVDLNALTTVLTHTRRNRVAPVPAATIATLATLERAIGDLLTTARAAAASAIDLDAAELDAISWLDAEWQ